jgi:meiotic recombination protein SPO11
MSYDASSLTTPDIKWLGLRPSDLKKFNIPEQCQLPMTQKDMEMGAQLLKEPFIQKNPEWCKELQTMLTSKVKAEIQSLSSYGFQFVSNVYLPRKLREGDWL